MIAHSAIQTISSTQLPEGLQCLPQPVSSLFIQGDNWQELITKQCIAVVGSRRVTPYGRLVTEKLTRGLVRHGVVIISGLAIGVDSIAHTAALEAGGSTIAVLPSSLDCIYPSRHEALAHRIYKNNGVLVSEYPSGTRAQKWSFIERNRLIAGLAQAVLVTEAAAKSGTLHTAEFALEQGKDVLAVPGNITSATSLGTNALIQNGAQLVTSERDVLEALGLQPVLDTPQTAQGDTPDEQVLLDLMTRHIYDSAELLAKSALTVQRFNQALTMLEIKGIITRTADTTWTITA